MVKFTQKFYFAESRLVWQHRPEINNAHIGVSPDQNQEDNDEDSPKAELIELATSLGVDDSTAIKEINETVGTEINVADLRRPESGDKRSQLIATVAQSWTSDLDRLSACIGMIFGKAVEPYRINELVHTDSVSAQLQQEAHDAVAAREGRLPPPIDIQKGKGEIIQVSHRNFSSAEHARETLDRNPNLQRFLNASAERWGFRPSILASFIEIESSWNIDDTPTYLNSAGAKVHAYTPDGKPEKKLLSKKEREARGLRPYSSAHGLAQVMRDDAPAYLKNRYDTFVTERAKRGESSPIPNKNAWDLFYDPEVAIDYIGWHLRNKVNEVDHIIDHPETLSKKTRNEYGIDKGSFPQSYKVSGADVDPKWLYLSYNNGSLGYLVLRRYAESKTDAEKLVNQSLLVWFQKRDYTSADGKKSLGLEADTRLRVGDRARQVVQSYENPVKRTPKKKKGVEKSKK